jgi:hypothetical protein
MLIQYFDFKTVTGSFSSCFPKQNEKRHNHDGATDLEKDRIDQGLEGNPCQHGCGDVYAGAAG